MAAAERILIQCIGVDRKIHVCEPHKDKTDCGVKVLRKEVYEQDYNKMFSCWQCTY